MGIILLSFYFFFSFYDVFLLFTSSYYSFFLLRTSSFFFIFIQTWFFLLLHRYRGHLSSTLTYTEIPMLEDTTTTMALASVLRRHSLQKKNKKIIDGKTIKDPAFKALFQDMTLLEHF